jgi:CDP-diacylglycerol---glycerol-3-phosphate 3-phosphatidyltransferase
LEVGAKRQYQGPMGKSDRALWLSIVVLVLACGIQAELWVNIVLGLMVFLLVVTIVNRAKGALKESAGAQHVK